MCSCLHNTKADSGASHPRTEAASSELEWVDVAIGFSRKIILSYIKFGIARRYSLHQSSNCEYLYGVQYLEWSGSCVR
jgi:hypothetical protein